MNNTPLILEGFSKNLRYVFTNKGIYDFINDKSLRYESISLINSVNILKEVQDFEYKSKQISLQEHLSNPRRAMIALSEILFPENNLMILKEWESNFGNKLLLINESTETLLIEERINDAWNGIKLIFEELEEGWLGDAWESTKKKAGQAWDWGKKKAGQAWDWIKEKAMSAWKCLTDDFTKCLMEGLREALFSPAGMAVEVFLTVTGVGAPLVMILYGLLLVWDAYLLFTNSPNFSWWNILFDVLGMLTSGVGVAGLRAVVKSAGLLGKSGKSLEVIIKEGISKGGKVGSIIKTIGNGISRGISSILGFVRQGTEWVSKTFGIKFLNKWVDKAKGVVDNISSAIMNTGKSIDKSIEKVLPKTAGAFKKDVFGNVIKNPVKISTGIRAGGVIGGIGGGIEKYSEYKQEKSNKDTEQVLNKLKSLENLSGDELRAAGAF